MRVLGLRILVLVSLAISGFVQIGCQTAPTVARENPERKLEGAERLLAPVRVTPETVVVDARPQFEYSVAHIPRSINLQWQEFTERETAQRGILQNDLFGITRRLARFGVDPSSHVVVVGQGFKGIGEEGRIAWMLAYLGVQNVQFSDIDALKARFTNNVDEGSAKAKAIWKPEPVESLNVTRDEVLFAVNNKGMFQPIKYDNAEAPVLYRVIDVRTAREYLGRGSRKNVPNIEAINIPWQEFFDSSLRVRSDIGEKLKTVGILPEHRIIVMDNDGVSSAACTMALRALGFSKAGNYAGGWNDLLSRF